jgi:hypothetical protein
MKLVLEVFDNANIVALAIVERPWILYEKSMITLSLIFDKGHFTATPSLCYRSS